MKSKQTDSKMIVDNHGKSWWNAQGLLHRFNGPAVEATNGYKSWYINGLFYCCSSHHESAGGGLNKDFIFGILQWCEEVSRLTKKKK